MKINSRALLTLGIIIALFAILTYSNSFSQVKNSMTDGLYGGGKSLDNIIIVKIDDDSINKIGRWPWDRDVFAQILDKVKDAKAIGVDVSFFEPSNNDSSLENKLKGMDNTILATEINGNKLYKPIFDTEVGYVNFFTDSDGVTRSFEGRLSEEAEPFSFALYKIGWDKNAKLNDKRYYINFAGEPGTFNSIGAYELLNSNIGFKDKFVLIGATAPNLHDNYFVPTSNGIAMSGVEIHANTLRNFILNNFVKKESNNMIMLFVIIFSLLGIFLISRLKIYYALLILVLAIAANFYLSIIFFSKFDYIIDLFFLPLALLISTGAGIGINYMEEKKQNKFITEAFGKYVSKDLLNEIVSKGLELKLGGIKKEITVFFSDIRGFTSIGEKLSPEELVHFLNEYLSIMTKIILKHKGTVDKFVGDAIMAFWNAPLEEREHVKFACESAIEQSNAVKELKKKFAEKNLPDINIGCGINTGEAIIGNMGSHERFDYTAIGDNINLASRLEGLTKPYGVNIIVSESTYEKVKNKFSFRRLDRVTVKGRKNAVKIYELCTDYDEKFSVQFEKALELYFKMKFKEAKKDFEKAEEMKKGDKSCNLFIERCDEFSKNPPADGWDGVFEMKVK
ncbi:MAG: adenylate/guanylate cyclase domain-containing protein [archaeon]|nr:adenylate/guanylate cyclase domain-containing protein [archaeon]